MTTVNEGPMRSRALLAAVVLSSALVSGGWLVERGLRRCASARDRRRARCSTRSTTHVAHDLRRHACRLDALRTRRRRAGRASCTIRTAVICRRSCSRGCPSARRVTTPASARRSTCATAGSPSSRRCPADRRCEAGIADRRPHRRGRRQADARRDGRGGAEGAARRAGLVGARSTIERPGSRRRSSSR